MEASNSDKAIHLCILTHGMWGKPLHLKHLKETLSKQYPSGELYVFAPNSNAEYLTYDGIETGAERVTHEIEAKIAELTAAGAKLKKISIAGYSLGGLVARYVVGLLHKNGVFDTLEPTNFTTFATPHLGTRAHGTGYGGAFWNTLGAKTLSASGAQMFLADSFRDTGKPLLSTLADPNSIFIQGLRRFKRKSVYANTLNDRSVPYYTACITRVDPFVDLEAVDLHYLEGQAPEEEVILDPESPVTAKKTPQTALTLYQRSSRSLTNVPFYALLTVLLPIGATFFLVNSGIQSFRSAARMKLHEEGKAGITTHKYRMPLLEDARAMQERVYEQLNNNQQEEYLPTPPPEPASSSSSASSSSTQLASEKNLARQQSKKNHSPWPTLALNNDQFAMIDGLDSVGLIRYPCHIDQVRHTHAAIVVRSERSSYPQGRAVVQHWASNFIL
ncbi:hypothetical protein B0A48_04190 [Cryoendolithus antarcticus]|uniref:DUF676 domain-containing protein n=1 Tax=Cryoendolithus antarcticus TaxID=1507870 RepID=A0A1V8TEZ7_9PEZI|nr:hypothetical protein B0A48_04190 [Cryoendolithus antarcticus]